MYRVVLILLALAMAGCVQQPAGVEQPPQAGTPLDPGTIGAIDATTISGDQRAMQQNTAEFQEELRKSIKLADPTRPVNREWARTAAKRVQGVRSVAWLDHANLLAIVVLNNQRTYQTIDAICRQLEPLGDTLGVVVNLQSGAAVTGDEREILSRNCELVPGDRGLLQANRQVDVIAPKVRAQHQAVQAMLERDARDLKAEAAESLRIIKSSTKQM